MFNMRIIMVIQRIITPPTIFHTNYRDKGNSWKNFWKFWNGPLFRNKSDLYFSLNIAAY